ncbi:MAG: hypothetical protein LBP59_14850 [Planctomycetaceae bacterium]|nr:hypothetical protein [Planctomycetaceae bacterium]
MNGYNYLLIVPRVPPVPFVPQKNLDSDLQKSVIYKYIQIVVEIQRFKSVKACRPKARQAKVNAN